MNSRDNASRWLSFSFSVHDTMCTYQKNETESQMNSSWILYRSSLDGGFPIRADLQQGISAAVGGIFAEILGVETLRWICPALVLPVFFSFGHRWPRLRGRTIGVCRIKRFCIRVAVPQRFFRDQSLLLVCCPVAPQLSGPCRNDRDGPQDPYRHCTTVPNTHFSGPQDWCTIMCRHLVERNTVAWSPGSAAAQLFCMVDSVWVWLHKGKACDEERGWTGASSCVWSRPTVPYHEAGHWMFLGQMWVSTFQAPLLVLGKTFCGSVGNRMIRGWMSVQFSSRWYLCNGGKAHIRSTLSLRKFPSVAFEMVAFSRPLKQDRQALPFPTPLSSRRSIGFVPAGSVNDCVVFHSSAWSQQTGSKWTTERCHENLLRKPTVKMQTAASGDRHSSGAVWESRWTSWAVRPNEPSGFRGRKDLLHRASALVTTCP